MAQSPIHQYVESLDHVPRKLFPLYEAAGDGFALTPAGKALAGYRTALAKEPFREPIAQKRTLTRSHTVPSNS